MASNDVVGGWGRKDVNNPWTFIPRGRITEIRIRCGGCVDSIWFGAWDDDKSPHHSETYGGDGGTATTITFADDEEITAVSGTVGEFSSVTVITSLSFRTNKKSYGPYGLEKEISFTLPVTKGKFIGFNGDQGDYLCSFGVILRPSKPRASSDVVGGWGRKDVNNPWTFIPRGRITEIRIRCGGCVDSIWFGAWDDDKIPHHSETYGGDGGTATTITFADDEEITAVSGTVGVFSSVTVITSLLFRTNKKSYGPYGPEKGISFTLPVTKGKFIRFNGDQGDYLCSFGVILRPY